MKRFLLWLVGVVLGVGIFLGAVMGVSYAFTTEGGCPDSTAQFGTEALEPNGWCWQVPLIGGKLDKVFASPATLTVQKLGTLYTAHPAITLPDWASYTTLTIQNAYGSIVFVGSVSDYQSFLFPANGEYKAELSVWRGPEGGMATQFEGGSTGSVRKNLGLEKPAKPTGWYRYAFRFTLQASAEVELSAERAEQGGIVGLRISGMTGDAAPTVETDLGNVQCVRAADGWRAYIPAAYNASSGGHEVNITVNGETITRSIIVLPKDFGTVDVEPEPDASDAANTQFRNAVWGLYEAPAREKMWQGGFVNPVESYTTLVDYGQVRVVNGRQSSRSNSTKLYTIPGEPCRAPANGVVVLAEELALTGNTVVIDHGCGMRSYLYGLQTLSVSAGQTVEKGQAVGVLGEELTACGTISELSRRISVIRSRNISMSCVFQNLAGLQNRYPQNQWQEILGNCDVQFFLGCTDQLTAEYVSQRTGIASVAVSSTSKALSTLRVSDYTPQYRESSGVGKRPVLTPDEVLRLPVDEALVILRGHKVLKVHKMDYSLHPAYKHLRECKASAHIPEWRKALPETLKIFPEETANPPRHHLSAVAVLPNQKRWLPPTKNPS